MNLSRPLLLKQLNQTDVWDIIVIGGGATGLGCAVEAASRGYKTLLLEQSDFAKGTSSRTTKMIHGGVRYLRQGNFSLVSEALHERGLLRQNAPHLVHPLALVIPKYKWWESYYRVGLKLYDMMAGQLSMGASRNLSREETLERLPTLNSNGLKGGVLYFDAQFDDARLAITLAKTMIQLEGLPLNYMKVDSLPKSQGKVCGVSATDILTGDSYEIKARSIINATGIFSDNIRQMDNESASMTISVSQGIHLVLDRKFLPGNSSLMIPNTSDGRVLFAIPWHNKVLLGTTETSVPQPELEPKALGQEIEFLLDHAKHYLQKPPQNKDVLSVFAGMRPLVGKVDNETTAKLSREHQLLVSDAGLVTIIGGKWTTYRKMGEDTIDKVAQLMSMVRKTSTTKTLRLHGWEDNAESNTGWNVYGADLQLIRQLEQEDTARSALLHPSFPYRQSEVIWAVREEMAQTVEDVLSRRTRALLLDAKASVECAPQVAKLIAQELSKDDNWIDQQIRAYHEVAQGYMIQ
jgi:glycerol-3-phosphate dehydrogenase